jgi:hypothetical protein
MDWELAILPLAPYMVGQAKRHGWGALRAALPETRMWHHEIIEAHQQPDASSVTGEVPGQTTRASPQRGYQPSQRPIPPFHKRGLDGLSQLPRMQLRKKPARPAEDHAGADFYNVPGLVPHFHALCVEQVFRSDQARFGLAADFPPPPGPIHHAYHLKQRRGVGLPSVCQAERQRPYASHDLRNQRRSCVLGTRAKGHPQQEPAPHRQGRMDPLDSAPPPLGMGFIHLPPLALDVLHGLLMIGVRAVGRDALEAIDCLESHRTDSSSALIADTPPLTLQQPFPGLLRQLAPGHQRARPLGELLGADGTTQPFDVLVFPCPRPMRDVAFAGTIALPALWIRARESGIRILNWRRLCQGGPPVARHGPKDRDVTPVLPRYYSPGLPGINIS